MGYIVEGCMLARVVVVVLALFLGVTTVSAGDPPFKDWKLVSSIGGPGPLYEHSMVYDEGSDRVLVFGGRHPDVWNDFVWSYDYNADRWENLGYGGGQGAVTAYDAESRVVIKFPSTMAYDPITRNEMWMDPDIEPPHLYMTQWGQRNSRSFAFAYDSESDRVILFGGEADNYGCRKETWSYDYNTNTWTKMNPDVSPGIYCPLMAYDSGADRMILFGGWHHGDGKRMNETWAYDYNTDTWERRYPKTSPPARTEHAMVYDVACDRVLVFGGHGEYPSGWINDTWAYDYHADDWARISTDHLPLERMNHAMAYDSESKVTILFGGFSNNQALEDTWALIVTAPPEPPPEDLAGQPTLSLDTIVIIVAVLAIVAVLFVWVLRRSRRNTR